MLFHVSDKNTWNLEFVKDQTPINIVNYCLLLNLKTQKTVYLYMNFLNQSVLLEPMYFFFHFFL